MANDAAADTAHANGEGWGGVVEDWAQDKQTFEVPWG